MSFCHNRTIFVVMKKKVHVTVYGKGKAVVLLHGFLESSTMWQPLIPALSQKNQVICIDLPGFGKSPCLAEIHSMDLFAQQVKEVLDELKIQTATLLGHSMGGYVGLAFAELFPEKIEALILLNSSTLPDSPERKKQRLQAIDLAKQNKERYVSLAINNLFTAKAKELFPEAINQLKTEAQSFPLCGITAALLGMKNRKNQTQTIKSATFPSYLIAGTEDPLIPFSTSKTIANNDKISLFTLEGGHMGVIENKDEIVKILHLIDIL